MILAVGPTVDLDELESVASILVTNLMIFGKMETEPPVDQAKTKG